MLCGSGDGKWLRKVITDTLPFLPAAVVDTIMDTLRNELVSGHSTTPPDGGEAQSNNQLSSADGGGIHGTASSPSPSPSTSTALEPHDLHSYINSTMRLEETLIERMNLLTPTEFERILHPIFEEDELTLIIAGAWIPLPASPFL
jgi:hypothetical protein